MNTAVIRYQTSADQADENQRLIENVFAELAATRPEGLRYQCVRLDDGVTFVHVVSAENDSLPALASFQEFQRQFAHRVAAGPDRSPGQLVGSYAAADSTRPAAVRVALEFLDAFATKDSAKLASLLDPDVVFESPRTTLNGADAVATAIGGFAQAVLGVSVIAAYGDEERAVVMYDMELGPLGTIRASDHLVVRDGRVISDQLVFDTHVLRDLTPTT
ncbi:nuclear transport factor 2 family protein [Kribbella sp. NBC_01245]|uniref:nuclear transport factor 2 family protein n=1 Tax=Kribbella sp. NBC_01245 TaxID=2903578 RepID=UPI002E2C0316|nr:nuclear transport factor 2 family protein [Kribbella sp. NBC_01245]